MVRPAALARRSVPAPALHMARLARVVIPGLAHHITQRGNGRQRVFFSDADCALYLRLLRDACAAARVTCLAFCLMPNHVHLILVPISNDGLRQCLSSVHRAYAGCINTRRQLTGHFWQGRYGSVPMDDAHLYEALRYVLLNPVRARLVRTAAAWQWSSAGAYLTRTDDGLTNPWRMLTRIPDIVTYLDEAPDAERLQRLRAAETIGRPAVAADGMLRIESQTGRLLRPGRRGPRQHTAS
jgi:putative transposase